VESRDRKPEPPARLSLAGPAIGTLVFAILVPGTVVGVVPFLLSRWRPAPALLGCEGTRWLGALFLVLAIPLFVDFLLRFVREGRGTPAPVAPPRQLVVRGPFRYLRNPGYVAVVAMLVGQGLLLGSKTILVYAACMALGFHLFVVLYEEPSLRARFGADYEAYCGRVPRWLPHFPNRRSSA
jgi:protein-S-isoprenylcysteine O-methyltransferase Ste14